jgi:hypothetical protein
LYQLEFTQEKSGVRVIGDHPLPIKAFAACRSGLLPQAVHIS